MPVPFLCGYIKDFEMEVSYFNAFRNIPVLKREIWGVCDADASY
jgi:hypothetical protein